ncbi:hypothetical protein Sme01_20880 [Sphaerisporangium melleum]|uniref:Uncharacterized protein n=1 Tax=Sphaerisporangium melleum TaxID=321316 RepID=A0A917QYQ0_9ACTN|nr:hypothetical protein [Sphaerisporangium melleum]GGK76477.1 hypothetical protein GCM10007964_19070 [Sphaerisporangium melleum]GII69612.1 hypothetical protein Sme01_20880 [Sphaerisporangium melleum]
MKAGSSMEPVHRSMPIVASGVASAVKLLVATLALCGAYFGAAAGGSAVPAAAGDPAAAIPAGRVRTVILSAQAMPAETGREPRAGVVTVGLRAAGTGCRRTYHAESVLDPGRTGSPVVYGWRLSRWSPAAHAWKTQRSTPEAVLPAGVRSVVEWHPRITGHPGRYRVELLVSGRGAITGAKFTVAC